MLKDMTGNVAALVAELEEFTERKRAEETLKTNEERFRTLIENASDAIAILDEKGTILYESPSAEKILGHEPKQLTGVSFPDLVHPNDMQRVAAVFASVMEYPGKIVDCQLRVKRKDGSWREVEGTAQNLLHDPKIGGIVVNYRDITQHKKMEEVLRESEERLKILFDASPDALYLNDLQGRILEGNKAADTLLGYSREDYLGKSFMDLGLISPEQIVRAVTLLARRQAQDPTQKFDDVEEFDLVRKDGSKVTAEIRTVPVIVKGQGVLLGIARDITERKQAEKEIRMLSSVVEQSTEGMAIAGLDGILIFVNEAWCRMHGYKNSKELLGKNLAIFHNEQQIENDVKPLNEKVIELGAHSAEVGHVTRDGRPFPTVMTTVLLKDKQGKPYALAGIAKDVTEQRQVEQQVRERGKELQAFYSLAKLAEREGITLDQLCQELADILLKSWQYAEIACARIVMGGSEFRTKNFTESAWRQSTPIKVNGSVVGKIEIGYLEERPELDEGPFLKEERLFIDAIAERIGRITERKKAEETLKESEERLKILFDYAPDLYCLSTPEGIVVDANKFALELFGYRREEIVGKSFMESGVVSLDQFEGGTASTTQRPGDALQMVLNRKDGTKVIVEIKSIPVTIKGQSLMLSIARDITERKKAEEKLLASERRFKTLFESSRDAIMLLSPERGFFRGNPAAVEMFGCKDEAEFTTKTPAELSPEYQPDGRPSMAKAQEMIAIAMEKGSHFFEWTHRRVDGREFFADVLLARMEWEGQTVLQATVRDISERRKAEEALKASEEFYSKIMEQVEVAICIIGVDGRVVYQSAAGERLWGPVSETGGAIGFDIMHPDDLPQVMAKFAELLEGKQIVMTSECRIKHKDGTYHWCSTTATNCLDNPVVKGLVMVTTDITERKKVEEAIAESEKRYRLLAENASDVISVVGMDFKPKYMSPSTTRLLGYTVEEAMAHGMENGLTPSSLQIAAEAFSKAIAEEQKGQKQKPMTVDLEFKRKDGSTVWVATSVSFIRDSEGKPVEILSNLHDITERKRAQEEMERAKEIAEAANRAKSDFLASMSHEIRTPMNGVVGMTGLLADTPLNPEQRDYVESVRSSAEALMAIINDILDFSKVEAGKLTLEKMDFDLRSAMENMSDVLAVRAREKGLEYVWLLEPNVPTRLVGDPGRLRQILINLVGNAVKFTPKGNVDLRVSLVSESDTEAVVQFDVRDTGIGIPSEKIGSLFKPFSQADTSTTRKYGGTGLGLSISKRLVELMGGQIGAESREDMGSTFWFTARLGKQSGERKSQELPHGISGLRVLGVDDNLTNRKVLEHMLQAWGCRVEVVESAAIAMARLHAAVVSGDPFRVAIIDIMMPEVDGETLGRMVKATPQLKDTVLIASSSSSGGRDDAARLGMVGFAHYLTKPVKQSQLFNAIASCVTREGEKTTAATCSATAAAAPSSTAVAETSQEQKKARILLAEDNVVNQKVAIAMLRKLGYSHIDVAASGIEALKALEKMPYDLVLMDVHMPEMDGLEATRRIRDAKSTVHNHLIPVVAMTASAMKGDREMCLDAGMNDYISKPINRAELVRVLEQWAAPQPAEKTSPPEAKASPADRVFDRPSLLERVGGDEEICAEILKSFVEDVPERVKEMENSLVQGDSETLKRGAHTVKGAAGNVSALMLREAASRLEAAVAAGELGSAREMLDAIAAEFGRFKKAIGQS